MAETKTIKMLADAGSYKAKQVIETDASSADFLIDKGLAEETDAQPRRRAAKAPVKRVAKRAPSTPDAGDDAKDD